MSVKLQNLFCLILILLFASTGFAQVQANNEIKWLRIKDDKIEFSILFPSNYLVDNEIEKSYILAPVHDSLPEVVDMYEKPRIIAHQKNVKMSLSVYQLPKSPNAKNYLWYFVERNIPKENYQDFRAGDFIGRKTTFDTEKIRAVSVAIAIKNKVFLINASADNEDIELYNKFLMSLTLDGKLLFTNQTLEPTDATQSVVFSNLQTSPEIIEALNQKHEKSEVQIVKNSAVTVDEVKGEQNFSRPLILLRQPHPKFSYAARGSNTAGIVRLKVNFLATGQIGNIVIVSEVPNGLTESAVNAAKKIKFLPAEIDKKKVDVTKTIEYAFNVK